MRHSHFLSSLVGVLLAVSAVAIAQTPQPPPTFDAIFTGQLVIGPPNDVLNTTGPFGTRIHSPLTGGNLTDAKTGEVLATLLPTTDNGIISNSGILFPSAVLPYVWKADGRLASIAVNGIGDMKTGSLSYAYVETDSPAYSWMNSNFFLFKVVVGSDPQAPEFTLYRVANTTKH
ncbi:hypothetical protein BD309DRAFT_974233 [Dichomitus squalens]|nr:hypothetical protein BD309DRAFT_974233 [Dichomitus squalens]